VTEDAKRVVIIGGGPAGLTAAYELSRNGADVTVLEASGQVGGISRTVDFEGYRFDLGGHRFFSKSEEVERLWDEFMAPERLLVRNRLSRIYYGGKFYFYPLKIGNALSNMGIVASGLVLASYAWAHVNPRRPETSFEDWVSNRFGRRLYEMFFKSYTEKVWGIPCTRLSAEWAAQRIKGLSLTGVLLNALKGGRGNTVKTLIEQFRYPPLGPGQLWEACATKCVAAGVDLRIGERVTRIARAADGRVSGVVTTDASGAVKRHIADDVLSSMPIRDLFASIEGAPEELRDRAKNVKYRGFIVVAVVFDEPDLFPDNWVYIHAGEVKVGRVQNFKNWSPHLVPDPGTTCLGMEYFADPGDDLWTSPDAALIALAEREVREIGLVKAGTALKGAVVRVPDAYPVYETEHDAFFAPLREWLDTVPGLACIGRAGQHRYNNMDHSMMTGLLAARNVLDGGHRDVWSVNTDAEYHEEQR